MTTRLTVARWLGYFMLVDLLFLPYFQLLIMPFSLPLVLAGLFLMRVKIRDDRYALMFGVLAFAVLVSLAISIFNPRLADFQMENVKRAVQLLSSFAYFFYFRWLARQVPLRTDRIAVFFLAWFGLLAAAFYLDPEGTGETIRNFYGRLVTSEETMAAHLRFSYQFTDPNTAAYFLLVAAAPLLLIRRGNLSLAVLAAVLVLCTFVTQSKGALLILALMLLVTLYPPGSILKALFSIRRIVLLLGLVTAATVAFLWLSDIFESNPLLKLAYDRISTDQFNTGSTRLETWTWFVGTFAPLPFGRGFILLINGIAERPHSDFLRLLFSYGFVALIPVLIWFFGRLKSWPVLILPAMMAFFINSLIDEQKLLGLFLALLAIQIGNEERLAHER